MAEDVRGLKSVRKRTPTMSDPRIESIFQLLTQLAAGNLDVHLDHSGEGDVVDAIIESVNMLAQELRASRAELDEAHQTILRQEKLTLMGQLCGGVAHELRNPLGALKNAVYFLRMALERPDPEVQETLGIIEGEVGTCESIIGNLLDFARPKEATWVTLGVDRLVGEVLARTSIPPGIELELALEESAPRVRGDTGQLGQALANILRNAVQAMGEQGRLAVSSAADGDGVVLTVTDSGEGIAPDRLDRIFEPLYSSRATGIGLGLTVTRTVIERHGGSITVRSAPGRGTTFTVRLPGVGGGAP